MSALKNWSIAIGRDGTPVTVTATSQVVQLTVNSDVYGTLLEDVMIDNPGPNDVFVKAGDPSVAATVNSVRVPAGGMWPFMKGTTQYLALVCKPGQTQAVTVHIGDGQ